MNHAPGLAAAGQGGARGAAAQSNAFVRVHFRETEEPVFDARNRVFQFFGGSAGAASMTTPMIASHSPKKTTVEAIFVAASMRNNMLKMLGRDGVTPVGSCVNRRATLALTRFR